MKNLIAFLLLFFFLTNGSIAQVSINTDGAAPDNSAMLDVKSASKGFLPPRVALTASNVAAPVTSPASGLLIYNTATAGTAPNDVAPGYYYWDGTIWTSLLMPAGTTGQTLRNDGGNWIANDVIYNNGTNVGIGTGDATHKLTVGGSTQTLRLIGPGSYGSTSQLNFGDGNFVYLSEDVDDNLLIHSNYRTAFTGGKVGIGTTDPTHKLTVSGPVESLGLMGPGVNGSSARLNFGDENYVYLAEDVDDKLTIRANRSAFLGGNVGIGTTEPGQMLTVAGTIHTTSGGVKFPDNTVQTTATAANVHYIGESYGGGKVFFVYDGGQHGLISATTDLSTALKWHGGEDLYTLAWGDGVGVGKTNTALILAAQGWSYLTDPYAATYCIVYSETSGGVKYGDWYLPSPYELNLLYQQKNLVGGFAPDNYWTSGEFNLAFAYCQNFADGVQSHDYKSGTFHVRAIRSF